jgi:hypothetical protein
MPTTSRTKKPAEPAFTEQPETPLALVTTDAPTEPTPEAAPEPIPWAELLSAATVVDRNLDKHRPGIEVPPEVLVFTQTLLNSKNAAYLPVANAQDYKLKKAVFQAAADKTTPVSSATVVPANKDKKALGKDLNDVAFLRVTVGERRGSKGRRTPATPAPATQDTP